MYIAHLEVRRSTTMISFNGIHTYSFICFAGSVFLVEDEIISGTISGTTVGSQVNITVFEISIFLFQGR